MNEDNILARIEHVETQETAQVARTGKEHIVMVFNGRDIVKMSVGMFLLVSRMARQAENRLLNG